SFCSSRRRTGRALRCPRLRTRCHSTSTWRGRPRPAARASITMCVRPSYSASEAAEAAEAPWHPAPFIRLCPSAPCFAPRGAPLQKRGEGEGKRLLRNPQPTPYRVVTAQGRNGDKVG